MTESDAQWQAAHEAKRAAALAELNTSLCFECQSDDERALRRLDINNPDLLICQDCAHLCHQCEFDLFEGKAPAVRSELVNNTSVAFEADEPEEFLCRRHWGLHVPTLSNSDADLASEDSRDAADTDADPLEDRIYLQGGTADRTAAGRVRFKWEGSYRRGYRHDPDVVRLFDLEPWEWRTDSELYFNKHHAGKGHNSEHAGFGQATSFMRVHEPPSSLPNAKRVAK